MTIYGWGLTIWQQTVLGSGLTKRSGDTEYTNWGPAEPNGGIMEQCLEMVHNTGTWNDLNSNILRFSMCKMRALAG